MITEMILDKLGVFYDDLAKNSHGNSPSISYGELIDRLLVDKGLKAGKDTFSEIGAQTFNRMMRKIFPEVRLNGGMETWFYHLLGIIEHKYCGSCDKIKPYSDFHKDITNISGITSACADCRNASQQGGYRKHYDSHQKSYAKNAGKIKARHIEQVLNRSKRIVPWTEKDKIEEFYTKCPKGYHVDHEWPLQSAELSGLHVIANLQYLPVQDNLAKGNKLDTTKTPELFWN